MIKINEVLLSVRNNYIYCDIDVYANPDLEFAFYVYRNGLQIHTEWYGSSLNFEFDTAGLPGYYHVYAFVRQLNGEVIDSKGSNLLLVNPRSVSLSNISTADIPEALMFENQSWKIPMLFFPHDEKKLYVLTPSAVDRSKHSLPSFDRYTWAARGVFDGVVLCVSDPTLGLSDQLNLGWCLGKSDSDVSLLLAQFILNLARHLSIDSKNIIIWGSSAGGGAALGISSHIAGSTAVAINPQTDFLSYGDYDQVKLVIKYVFDDLSSAEILNKFSKRVSMIDSHLDKVGINRVCFVQNRLDTHHYDVHFTPFWKRLGGGFDDGWNVVGADMAFIYSDPRGHVAENEDIAKDVIKHLR